MKALEITNAIVLEDGRVLIEHADGTFRPAQGKSDVGRLRAMSEEDIQAAAEADSDAPPADEDYWADASVVRIPEKQSITARFDRDVLDWFRAQGRGYQTRMNAVLRSYVENQRER